MLEFENNNELEQKEVTEISMKEKLINFYEEYSREINAIVLATVGITVGKLYSSVKQKKDFKNEFIKLIAERSALVSMDKTLEEELKIKQEQKHNGEDVRYSNLCYEQIMKKRCAIFSRIQDVDFRIKSMNQLKENGIYDYKAIKNIEPEKGEKKKKQKK